MSKNLVIAFAAALAALPAWAEPVLNLNAPGAEAVTVFPDHLDKNLYYLAPTVMVVAHDGLKGEPIFSYQEISCGWFCTAAIVQATMVPSYSANDIENAKQRILAANPRAQFTALPFQSSDVRFGDILKPLVEASDCSHLSGVVGEEEGCSLHLNSQGRKVLKAQLKQGLAVTMDLEYTILGVVQKPDGSYESATRNYGMAGRIGGPELARFPQLFRDSDGNVASLTWHPGASPAPVDLESDGSSEN